MIHYQERERRAERSLRERSRVGETTQSSENRLRVGSPPGAPTEFTSHLKQPGHRMSFRPTVLLVLALFYLGSTADQARKIDRASFNTDVTEESQSQQFTQIQEGRNTKEGPENPKMHKMQQKRHEAPAQAPRMAEKPKRKIHRSVSWVVGTFLTLATILVVIASVALTSRGSQTVEQDQESRRGCCCTLVLWLTKTSSQLPLWKSLLLKTMVTILSTLAAGMFSLLITNLLADREESIEATVRDILGIDEEMENVRRKRDVSPDKVHWLAVLFLVWLTTIPLVCYIVLTKCTSIEQDRSCTSARPEETEMNTVSHPVCHVERSNKRDRKRRQRKEQRGASGSTTSSPSLPSPPSPCNSPPTPPPTFWTTGTTTTASASVPAPKPDTSDQGTQSQDWMEQIKRGFRSKTRAAAENMESMESGSTAPQVQCICPNDFLARTTYKDDM